MDEIKEKTERFRMDGEVTLGLYKRVQLFLTRKVHVSYIVYFIVGFAIVLFVGIYSLFLNGGKNLSGGLIAVAICGSLLLIGSVVYLFKMDRSIGDAYRNYIDRFGKTFTYIFYEGSIEVIGEKETKTFEDRQFRKIITLKDSIVILIGVTKLESALILPTDSLTEEQYSECLKILKEKLGDKPFINKGKKK